MRLERFLWAKAGEVAALRRQQREGRLPAPFTGPRGDFLAALRRPSGQAPLSVIAEYNDNTVQHYKFEKGDGNTFSCRKVLEPERITALNVFVLFVLLSFLLFNPVRKLMKQRQEKIREELEAALKTFLGEQEQVPPMYSALKVGGQKLCDLARQGREVERKPRPVTIHQLTLLEFTGETLRLRVRCSKGTYIRTLCKDIGQALGCGGCMERLRRTQAGEYTIDQAVPLEELLNAPRPQAYLRGVDTLFAAYPAVTLTPNQEARCRNGNPFSRPLADGTYRAYGPDGGFLMLAKVENGVMSTIKSFFDVEERTL